MPETTKTVVLTGFGGYEKLEVQDLPRKDPGPNEVEVNIQASGINFAELMCRQGLYDNAPKLPGVLGLEGAGIISSLGSEVKSLRKGDRVLCLKAFGLWTEYAIVDADQCFVIPDEMTMEEAAAIPVNYITAYHMLFDMGSLRKNKSVLIHMAAGGVGIAATQLCKTVENVTVYGTASAGKHDIIKEMGVDYPIDYRTKDYVQEIRAISPKGVDIVLDPLSGDDSNKGFDLLKPLGTIVHFGAANMVTGKTRSLFSVAATWWKTKNVNPLGLMRQNKCVAGYHLGHLTHEKELVTSAVLDLIALYKEGKIKPRIDSVWSFDKIGDAMAQMNERKNIGKVIIKPHKVD
ncbi:DgyrCDS10246 [Dimorphilus gyrociliatus]|uniref:DgyrCDS10246 n=1 Tax=Dimorphilus gyrociliatus TaxID=2664684 RepID=A0A7I8VZK0_9ANNE|nr:DgyrCDS10246 [Dimorphilus gyrociliatus]